jgi:UDP-N-acetylglucosamine--N-acetylmuramyl-(pentapeptide) pyrophosphoryl-undecaprenol N-acetylglucosamine transferase
MFITSQKAIDKMIIGENISPIYKIEAKKMPESLNFGIINFLFYLAVNIFRCIGMLRKEKPDAVAGFGGYVSAPAIVAAFILRKPILIHEQNVIPGKATRFLSHFSDTTALSFEKTRDYIKNKKVILTGNPVRKPFFATTKQQACRKMNLDEAKFKILAVGGSQGSHKINMAVSDALEAMDESERKNICMIHLTGSRDEDLVKEKYERIKVDHKVCGFLDDVWNGYQASDLVIARCGAGVISEISACAKPSILIPYPYARAHQAANAQELVSRGASLMVDEGQLNGQLLRDKIRQFLRDRNLFEDMSRKANSVCNPNAARILADKILKMGGAR